MPTDPFHIPNLYKKEGYSYQRVRKSLLGRDDIDNIANMEDAGWRWVPKSQLSATSAYNLWTKGHEWAEYCGMVLMSRPDYMTMASQANERRKAFNLANFANRSPEMRPRITPVKPSKKPGLWKRLIKAIRNES